VVTFRCLPSLPVFPGVSKFFIKSPGKYPSWLFSILFSLISLLEVDSVLLFELFSVGKGKTEESNNWSEINKWNCTILGTVGAIFALCSENSHREHSEGLRMIFGENCRKGRCYNSKISRRLQIFVLWGLAGMRLVSENKNKENNLLLRVKDGVKWEWFGRGPGWGYFLLMAKWGCATGWGHIFTSGLTMMRLHFQQSSRQSY